jgi:NTP pyrophosphatase (non-canonical NTP hydrolase)
MQNYSDFVRRLFKNMGSKKHNLLHGVIGVSGEAGEMLDTIKKHWAYDKPLDVENLIEELGDIEFYLQAIRNEIGMPRDFIIEENMRKLNRRYPSGEYSNQQANARADKLVDKLVDKLELVPLNQAGGYVKPAVVRSEAGISGMLAPKRQDAVWGSANRTKFGG